MCTLRADVLSLFWSGLSTRRITMSRSLDINRGVNYAVLWMCGLFNNTFEILVPTLLS